VAVAFHGTHGDLSAGIDFVAVDSVEYRSQSALLYPQAVEEPMVISRE
jgi:hypothetical protein